MTLNKLLQDNPDGISFKASGNDYIPVYFKTGYFVALTDNKITLDKRREVIQEINRIAVDLNLKSYFYGYWKDQKTESEYLDLSLHITNRDHAETLARVFNQKAIFDCRALDSLYI